MSSIIPSSLGTLTVHLASPLNDDARMGARRARTRAARKGPRRREPRGPGALVARDGLDEDGGVLLNFVVVSSLMAHVTDESVIDTQFSILNLRTLRCGIAPSHASIHL